MDVKPRRILIVDDSPEDRATCRRLLERGREGAFIIAEADCGECGLRQCRSDPPDCVLLDYNLPDINGLEFLGRLRKAGDCEEIPTIFLTGAGSEALAAKAIKQGAHDYLVKGDITPEALGRAIHNAIDKAALQCEIDQQRRQLRRQAAELRESEERFRAFMDNSPGIAWIKDEEGRYLYVSKTYERRFGITLDDWRGKTDFELWPSEIASVSRNNDLAVLSDGQTREVLEQTNSPEGAPSYWWNSKFLIRGAAGRKYIAGFGADITRYKQLELKLERSVEQLRAADRRKDEFLAMLGHELRNPLASMRNDVQILRRMAPVDPAPARAVERIDQQVAHMVRLVDDLLDVSRISQGRISLQKERIELATLIECALATSRSFIEAHRHTLAVTLPARSVHLEGDPVRLIQVIRNLLDNAAKYTEDGGQIWLETEVASRPRAPSPLRMAKTENGGGRVDGSSVAAAARSVEGHELIVRVRDTGRGISPEFLPYVFDVFTQADHTLDRSQGGLGLGLTLVKQLVELHGGEVAVHSAGPGRGSEFSMRVPIVESALEEALPPGRESEAPTAVGAGRILVVDDNLYVGESMTTLLRIENYEARWVQSGSVALALVPSFKPEVVLLDIGLPGMSGYEVARRLRALPGGRNMLLIAVTGYGGHENQMQCQAAGFDHHIVKPVDFDALKALIELICIHGNGNGPSYSLRRFHCASFHRSKNGPRQPCGAAFFFGAAERVAHELDHIDRPTVALEAVLAQPMSIGIESGL